MIQKRFKFQACAFDSYATRMYDLFPAPFICIRSKLSSNESTSPRCTFDDVVGHPDPFRRPPRRTPSRLPRSGYGKHCRTFLHLASTLVVRLDLQVLDVLRVLVYPPRDALDLLKVVEQRVDVTEVHVRRCGIAPDCKLYLIFLCNK